MNSVDDLTKEAHRLELKFGIIKVIGIETVDFLQRISTNDFSNFKKGAALTTLFISDKGRLIDRVIVLHCGEYFLFLVTKKNITFIIEWLNKYIIMENIFLENISENINLLFSTLPIRHTKEENIFPIEGVFGLPIYISIEAETDTNVHEFVSTQLWDFVQMTNGIPLSPYEINDRFNPLEVNLARLISFTKGCYIGQEIIARLDSYKKVQKALYLISCERSVENLDSLILVDRENIEIGKITRMMANPHIIHRNIGLAVINIGSVETSKNIRIKNTSLVVFIEKSFEYLYGRN